MQCYVEQSNLCELIFIGQNSDLLNAQSLLSLNVDSFQPFLLMYRDANILMRASIYPIIDPMIPSFAPWLFMKNQTIVKLVLRIIVKEPIKMWLNKPMRS